MPIAWELTLTIVDEADKQSKVTIYFENADSDLEDGYNTFESINDAAQELLPVIDSMITGQIKRASIGRAIRLPSELKGFATSTSDVEEKGLFIFKTSYSRPRISIPTIKDSIIVDGGSWIDQSDPDVAMFIFMMIDGSGTAMDFTHASDNRCDVIYDLDTAYEIFKGRN